MELLWLLKTLISHRSVCNAASRRKQGLRKRGPSASRPKLLPPTGSSSGIKTQNMEGTSPVNDDMEQTISRHVEKAKEEHRLKTQVLTIHV